jgi:hypothetical protein
MAAVAATKPSVINPTALTTIRSTLSHCFLEKHEASPTPLSKTLPKHSASRGLDVLHRLANRSLPESMDTALFYKANKPYKINE